MTNAAAPTTDDFLAGLLRTQNILTINHELYTRLVARWCAPAHRTRRQRPLLS